MRWAWHLAGVSMWEANRCLEERTLCLTSREGPGAGAGPGPGCQLGITGAFGGLCPLTNVDHVSEVHDDG